MSTNGAPRRYGFACLMCRRRIIRCDGKKPHCANCLKAKEFCNYKESPTYNAHLVQQVQHFKLRAERLESQVRDLASVDHEERDRKLAGIVRELGNLRLDASPDVITEISLDTFSPFTNSAMDCGVCE
jgi:hypothetical protein